MYGSQSRWSKRDACVEKQGGLDGAAFMRCAAAEALLFFNLGGTFLGRYAIVHDVSVGNASVQVLLWM